MISGSMSQLLIGAVWTARRRRRSRAPTPRSGRRSRRWRTRRRRSGSASTPRCTGDLLGQLREGPAGEEHQALAVRLPDRAHRLRRPYSSVSAPEASDRPPAAASARLSAAAAASAAGVPERRRRTQPSMFRCGARRDGQRTRRHVVGDHRAGRGVGAVADRDRRHEHVVGAGAGVRRRSSCGAWPRRRSSRRPWRRRCWCPRRSSRRRRRTGAAPSRPRRSRRSSSRRTCRPSAPRPAGCRAAGRRTGRPCASGPISAPQAVRADHAGALARPTVSISVVSGPTTAPAATAVSPRSWVLGSQDGVRRDGAR